ncbi:putative integral membrane protein [Talaromyces proteolyticus]|uniref:Integral membrane protein n=1 Tax=Talaromyces proteolyticus TaxID=1131652 RepID=A0AAD4KNT4_9EURO|nr:putative integral membrane protein [Talaromyces proteolyticus]KAH8695604.1 putative integral membrane protein [Talaromyces proteolyticus]
MVSPVGGKDVPSQVPEIFGVNIAFTAVTVTIVLLRVFTRVWFVQGLKIDDYIMIVAGLLTLFYGIDVCLQTHYGFGYHWKDLVDPARFTNSLKVDDQPNYYNDAANIESQLFYGGELVYYINVGLTKISLLILYLRLFVTQSYNKLRLLTWVLLYFTTAVTITWTFCIMLQCNPVALAWDKTLKGTCINMTAVFYSHAGINILLDFIVYIMPIPLLWSVNRPLRERLALIVIFAIGGFVCIMGIVRLQSLRKATVSTDPSWDNVPSGLWSCMEADVGIICACLPSLKPFFARFFGPTSGSKSLSKSGTQKFHVLSDSQNALHQSHVEVELYNRRSSFNVVRTDDFRVETRYLEEAKP